MFPFDQRLQVLASTGFYLFQTLSQSQQNIHTSNTRHVIVAKMSWLTTQQGADYAALRFSLTKTYTHTHNSKNTNTPNQSPKSKRVETWQMLFRILKISKEIRFLNPQKNWMISCCTQTRNPRVPWLHMGDCEPMIRIVSLLDSQDGNPPHTYHVLVCGIFQQSAWRQIQ